MANFEVVPIWLNRRLPAVLPHLKAVLERRFWNGFHLARCITESSRCRRTAFLWAPFSILGASKSRRELCRDGTEAGEAVQSCVSTKIAAQGLMNAMARYRGEEASHRLTRNGTLQKRTSNTVILHMSNIIFLKIFKIKNSARGMQTAITHHLTRLSLWSNFWPKTQRISWNNHRIYLIWLRPTFFSFQNSNNHF